MPTEAELLQHVKSAIAIALGALEEELSPSTKLFEDLGVDSVDLLDIAYEIERLTGCELEVSEVVKSGDTPQPGREVTIQRVVDYLKTRTG